PDRHPDDKNAEERFKDLSEAYSVLVDPKKRSDYDMAGRMPFGHGPGGPGGPRAPGGPRGPGGPFQGGGFNMNDIGGAGGGGGAGMEDIFKEFFEGMGGQGSPEMGGRPQRRVEKGTDIEYDLDIDFMHAVLGAEVNVTVTRGGGKEKITVKIPPGITYGSKVKIASRGNPGTHGGPPGDLFITTKVRPHKYFKRKANDIYLDLPITINEALIGAEVEVPTLSGNTTVKIAPGTQGGQKLRLKGMGVANVQGAGKGDMYLNISISVPQKVNSASKTLIEEFGRINPYDPRYGLW
ncbi:MAG: J domain-containing protein, partial [Thermodesulfobacteriota bacterium]